MKNLKDLFSKRCFFWLAAYVFSSSSIFSQNLSQHNWYFGTSNNGIRFNRGTNVGKAINFASAPVPFSSMGGGAVATDPVTANLLFYTDGVTVYDASNNRMPGSNTPLSGNPLSNQAAVICPVPGQANKYFIFVNSLSGQIFSSVVDMGPAAFGNAIFPNLALGDLELTNKNLPVAGLGTRSEGMIIVPHTNGIDYWLITHDKNVVGGGYSISQISTTSYQATAAALVTTTIYPTNFRIEVASFAYNKELKKIAVATQSVGDNAQVWNFDPATGGLAFDRLILNTGTTSPLYDIEWSTKNANGDRFIYISRLGNGADKADVLQYDYKNSIPSTPITFTSSIITTPIYESYGLQLAPDSTIYHLYRETNGGPYLIEQLNKIDLPATQVTIAQPFGNTNFSATQFSSFSPVSSPTINLSFTTSSPGNSPSGTGCQDNPITFFPNVSPNADSLKWDFGDGPTSISKDWSPIYKYSNVSSNPQSFTVTLTAFYQGIKKTIIQQVAITQFDLKIQLNQEETACECELPVNNGKGSCPNDTSDDFKVTAQVTGGQNPTYVWSNGDVGLTLSPQKAGYYYLTATNQGGTGCARIAGVNVKQYGLQDQRSNIWYFGNKAGIDFNPPTGPVALTNSAMNAPEGCAIVCDRNGQTIFYTDGKNVYDKNNVLIPATDAGGELASTQSALIIPVPGDETLYYLVTTQEVRDGSNFEVRYSIFDLKNNKVTPQPSVLLFSKSTERITSNGKWLIAHEFGNSTFRVYKISSSGIGEPVYSDIGSPHSFQDFKNGKGYMKIGPKNTLAVPIPYVTGNFIELFHLNDTTGQIVKNSLIDANNRLDLNESNGEVYGLEFRTSTVPSTTDRVAKLFVTLNNGTSSKVIEFAIDKNNNVTMLPKIPSQGKELGAIQTGPNGQVYVAVKDATQLAVINPGADLLTPSTLQLNASPDFSPSKSLLGLPNFVQQQGNGIGGPGIVANGKCAGQQIQITGTPTDQIDEFQWTIKDSNGNVIHSIPFGSTSTFPFTFSQAGTYEITMQLRNRCVGENIPIQRLDLVINASPPIPTIAVPTCISFPVTLVGSASSPIWSTGETTTSIVVRGNASVSLTDINNAGCKSTSAAVAIRQSIPLNIEPKTVCQNSSTTISVGNLLVTSYTFEWSLNGVVQPSLQDLPTISVNTSTPTQLPGNPPLNYSVKVKDRGPSACEVTDNADITITASPNFTFLPGAAPSSCGAGDGTVDFQLNAPAAPAGPYSYSIIGPLSPPNPPNSQGIDQAVTGVITLTGRAGTYSAFVTDQISTCSGFKTIPLTDPAGSLSFTANPLPPNCDPVNFQIDASSAINQFTVTSTSSSTPLQGPTILSPAQSTFNINGFSTGSYVIELKNSLNCTAVNTVNVSPLPTPNVIVNRNCLTLTASGATNYTWSSVPPGRISGPTNTNSIVINGTGTVTYTVLGDNGGCQNSQSITLMVPATLDNDFISDTPNGCAESVVLSAKQTQTGNIIYRWYQNGSFISSLPTITITNSATYRLEVADATTGCSVFKDGSVQVNGLVNLLLSNTQACNDGEEFLITATPTPSTGITFAWFFNNSTTPISGATSATLNRTDAGNYKVRVSKATCTAEASIQIIKAPLPQGQLLDAVIICADRDNQDPATNQVDLNPGSFVTYNWFKDGLPLGNTRRVLNVTSPGTYKVDLTNSFGCTNSDQTEVLNECIPKIVGPNAFRPNSNVQFGSNSNREFFVYSFFVTDNFEVAIFNRWGELVFESKDRNFKWNGGYNNNGGQPLPGGTYSYIIRYQSSFRPQDGTKEQRGGVVLLR